MANKYIPQEILHETERESYKEAQKRKRFIFIENAVFVMLCAVILALAFYMGRIIERHLGFENVKPQKSAYVIKI